MDSAAGHRSRHPTWDHKEHPISRNRAIRPATPENIRAAAEHLRGGGLVGLPTETVYGLAASVWNTSAIAHIFASKDRPLFDPLIVHLAGNGDPLRSLYESHVVDLSLFQAVAHQTLAALSAHGWPGPLTLILPRSSGVPDLAAAGLPTIAVRIPDHPVAEALLRLTGPLVAPSANRFGRISPTRADDVADELGDRVSLILDGGPCKVGVESTILSVSPDGSLVLLRPGGTPVAQIEAWVRRTVALPKPFDKLVAPGQLPGHYAPRTPMMLLSNAPARLPARVGLLRMSPGEGSYTMEHVLSPTGELVEMARNLFAGLRALDDAGLDLILAEMPASDLGLGHAIRDRLTRAAHR